MPRVVELYKVRRKQCELFQKIMLDMLSSLFVFLSLCSIELYFSGKASFVFVFVLTNIFSFYFPVSSRALLKKREEEENEEKESKINKSV